MVHKIGAPSKGCGWNTATDDFSKTGQVRSNAVVPLRSLEPYAEAGDHFVVDKNDSFAGRLLSKHRHKISISWDNAQVSCYRLEDHCGDVVTRAENLATGFKIVERKTEGVFDEIGWHSLGRGFRVQLMDPGACLDKQSVGMSMVVSNKFDDGRLASSSSCNAQRAHGSFCS